MSEAEPSTPEVKPNGTLRFLLIGGPIIAALGLIVAVVVNSNAQGADLTDAYGATLSGGGLGDFSGAAGLHAAAIGWLVVGLVGVALLIVGLAIRAAKN
jgi:hypothetical protein